MPPLLYYYQMTVKYSDIVRFVKNKVFIFTYSSIDKVNLLPGAVVLVVLDYKNSFVEILKMPFNFFL